MSTMMSPFGLPEKRLTVATANASGTPTTSLLLQGHGEVSSRLQFADGNQLTLPSNIVNNNQNNATSNYLLSNENTSVNNNVGLTLRGWNQQQNQHQQQQQQHSHLHHHHHNVQQQQQNSTVEQHQLHQHHHSPSSLGQLSSSPSTSSSIIKREYKSEIIHSGHFMVSEIDDQQDDTNEVDQSTLDFKESPVVSGIGVETIIQPSEAVPKSLYHSVNYPSNPRHNQNSNHHQHQNQHHHPQPHNILNFTPTVARDFAPRRFIDEGLSKLFECMSLAYSGSITSPKWKTFKGLPLKLKDKIRLNNIIWRAWHIQYIIGRDPRVCQFSSPVDSDSHTKSEAVILEGKYWKRRHTTVVAEYNKWRAYHKNKIKPRPTRHSFSDYHDARWNEFFSPQDLSNLSVDGDFTMDFSDNLLNSLVPPNVIDFPNPREIARSGMGADFIQPGLTQLQPCLDDFMEPLSDFLLSRVCIMPPLPEESTAENPRDNWKSAEKQSPRFGGLSNPVNTSDYMQISYGDMLDVNDSNGVIKSFSSNQESTSNLVPSSLSNDSLVNTSNVIQVTGIPQQQRLPSIPHNHPVNSPSAQPQSPNVDVINGGGGPLDMNTMSPLESVNLQVQNSTIVNNISFANQSIQSTLTGLSVRNTGGNGGGGTVQQTQQQQINSLESQKNSRLFGSYDCIMDMSSINSSYNNNNAELIPKSDAISCIRNDAVADLNQSPRGSLDEQHFAYPKMPLSRSSRHRSRSVSTPHMVFKSQIQQQQPNQQQQQSLTNHHSAALTMNNVPPHQQQQSIKSTMGAMERSISLPIYSQRRNAIGPVLNAQIMQQSQVNFSSSNHSALRGGENNLHSSANNGNFVQSNSFNTNVQVAPPVNSSQNHSLTVAQYPTDSSMNISVVTPTNNNNQITHPLVTPPQSQTQQSVVQTAASSDFSSDSNSLIAQLLSNSGSPPNLNNTMGVLKSGTNDYDKPGGPVQHHHHIQQPLGLYSSHPSLHGSMLNYSSARPSLLSSNLMSANPGESSGLGRPLRGRISGRLSDPEPPRGLHTLSVVAGLKERVRKISSPAISPPPLLAYSPSSKDSNSSTPLASPQSIATVGSPSSISTSLSTIKTVKLKSDSDKIKYKEHRRVCHINAEQKRRCNIKNGFDTLRTLLPGINQNANTKISKAAMLHKAAEYIRTMKSERQQRQEECENLRQQIENLNQTIGVFQSQLPATGAPISCQRVGLVKEQFDIYIKDRSMTNWKFWIFGLVMESLLESYMTTVTTSDVDDMCRSILRWLDQNCSLVTLRREVLNSLRHLSTSTNILTSPSTLQEEILESIASNNKKFNNSRMTS